MDTVLAQPTSIAGRARSRPAPRAMQGTIGET